MTTFDNRLRGFEAGFVQDEAQRFRAKTLGYQLFAAWAAHKLHKPADETRAYVDMILGMVVHAEDDPVVLRQVADDLRTSGHPMDDAALREQMNKAMEAVKAG